MGTIKINTFEEVHHTCLMYGLKRAYGRYPFLVNNVMATPPPFRRSPELPELFIGGSINPVCVQYYKQAIVVMYKDDKVSSKEASQFSQAVVEEYLKLRHPYMKGVWCEQRLVEETTEHLIAEIVS